MHTDANAYTAIDNEITQTSQLETIRQRVAIHLREAYELSKKRYDTRSQEISYGVNDIVWKKNTTLSKAGEYSSSRLMDRYVKCKVKARVGTNTYLLTDLNDREIGIYSTKDLKAWPSLNENCLGSWYAYHALYMSQKVNSKKKKKGVKWLMQLRKKHGCSETVNKAIAKSAWEPATSSSGAR